MSGAYLSKKLRARISVQAKYRCGYCLTQAWIVGTPMEIDHYIPQALGGPTEEDNLWLACSPCNNYKGNRIAALDPQTGARVAIFNPRTQAWDEHFEWLQAGDCISGLTAVGRATILALQLNRPALVSARQGWVGAGWHPPREE